MPNASGTQSIDRAAQLLVAVADSADADRRGRAGRGHRPAQEHRLAAGGRARAARARPARRRPRAAAARAGDDAPGPPRRRRPRPGRARAPTRCARLADASARDDQPGRADAARRRAPEPGRQRPLHRLDELDRPPRPAHDARRSARSSWPSAPSAWRATHAALRPELDAVRARGYATAIGELEPGLAAMAAPVRDGSGDVLAALSISGPEGRLTRERIAELAPSLLQRGGDGLGPAGVRHHHPRSSMTHDEILQGLYDNTLIGNAPEVKDLTNEGLAEGIGPRVDALRRAHPVARGGRRPVRARRLLRARDADRRPGDAGRARHPAAASGRDRRQADRHVRDGHRQGRRARHRQEPREHHARGRRLHRARPRASTSPRSGSSRRSRSTSPTSSASRRS